MPCLIDLSGQRFGRLLVHCRSPAKAVRVKWACRCDCGNTVSVEGQHLRDGTASSCGCLQKERTSLSRKTHGLSNTRIYSIWTGMRMRCNSSAHTAYAYYGGRGIGIAPEWENPETFYAWAVSHGYEDHLEIDRIDNDRGYSPDNCRWVPHSDNMKNLRCNTNK